MGGHFQKKGITVLDDFVNFVFVLGIDFPAGLFLAWLNIVVIIRVSRRRRVFDWSTSLFAEFLGCPWIWFIDHIKLVCFFNKIGTFLFVEIKPGSVVLHFLLFDELFGRFSVDVCDLSHLEFLFGVLGSKR